MTLPNFILIGAVKSGTTSAYQYLKEHPEIYMSSVKEPKFFQWEGESFNFTSPCDRKIYDGSIKTLEEYKSLFEQVDGERAVGEASPSYLYNESVPMKMHRHLPDAKLIAILRQPADRAFSHYLHTRWLGYETLHFEAALQQEPERIQLNWGPIWHYKQQGYYYNQIKRFQDVFGKDQMRIYLFDDFKKNTLAVVQDMYAYLGVDPDFRPKVEQRHNEHFFSKNQILQSWIEDSSFAKSFVKTVLPDSLRERIVKTVRSANDFKPVMDQDLRQELTTSYNEDILKLQDLIQKDLSSWTS
ncbi:MAG: sulfotransferase [Microcoleaceae cyanobacterium]